MHQREPNGARKGRIETWASIPGGYPGWVPFPRTLRVPGRHAAASDAVPIPLVRRASSSPASMSIDSPVQVACARAATKPGTGRSPDTLCAGVAALRHNGKAARRTAHNSSPALKENAPIGPTDNTGGDATCCRLLAMQQPVSLSRLACLHVPTKKLGKTGIYTCFR